MFWLGVGGDYRGVRVFDLDDGMSRLFIYPTDVSSPEPGVPYWLQEEALRRWVIDETGSPTDEEPDWEAYRAP